MATITTPTQLATFSQPHASSSKSPHVTLSPVVGDSKSAVAAVRGDGIWTYDLNTLRPTTSFTVPPSTVFSTSPISYWVTRTKVIPRATAQGSRDVAQVIEVMDVDLDEGDLEDLDEVVEEEDEEDEEKVVEEKERITLIGVDKDIWLWKGDEGDKEIITIDKSIKSIHHLESPRYPILIITSNEIFLLDESFNISQGIALSLSFSDILTSKIISNTQHQTRLIFVGKAGNVSVSKLILEGDIPRLEKVAEGKIGNGGQLGFVDISEDGVISALDESNNLYTSEISSLTSSTPSSSSSLRLNHSSSTPVLLSLPTKGKPVILLPTSHPTPSLLLTIPLSTIPAILSSTSISSFTSTGSISHLSIISGKNGILTIGIVLNHLNSDGESGRSVIYTCEIVLPEKGIGISNLLGTKEKTEQYLSIANSNKVNGTGESSKSKSETEQNEIIRKIEQSLRKNDISSAEKSWKDYISKVDSTKLTESSTKRIINSIFSIALNEEGKPKGPYASNIITDLVERGMINDSMWKASLVGEGLLPCGDWDDILLCLRKLRTIPSVTLVKLISTSLNPSNTDKIQHVPRLDVLLKLILNSPPSPTFKIDLCQNLSVRDATSVLEQFVGWLGEYVGSKQETLKGWDDDEPSMTKTTQAEDEGGIPKLDSIIKYSIILLDSHLNQFLSHEPSYTHLETLNELLGPLIDQQNDYKKLRGPIEALLILSRRESRKALEKEEKAKAKGNNRQGQQDKKKKGSNEGTAGSRLPEEKVGKWKVEDLVF